MEAKDMYHSLKIRKKPWYTWLFRIVWFAWIIFWIEAALGSWKELEPRAAAICLGILVFSLAIGILLWSWGRLRPKKES
jgi:hypothetical protein